MLHLCHALSRSLPQPLHHSPSQTDLRYLLRIDDINVLLIEFDEMGKKMCCRLAQVAFNLEDPAQLQQFLRGEQREITVPGSRKKLQYDPLQRTGVGLSRLGTSEATAIGAYAFALQQLDAR